ncbi:MAG: YfiR family protein [Gammaproteobacteria bacterium]
MASVRYNGKFQHAGSALLLATLLAILGPLPILLAANVAMATPAPSEYQVKAVFLFNFTQFVDWPAQSFADARAPFVIGVLGRDPFGSALDEAVRGEMVNGRALVVERYRNVNELKPCQILFIDRSAGADVGKTLESIGHQGTLTVSDSDAQGPADVIIRFLSEGKKIRLRINVDSARDAGLTISSKLLRPAEVVGSPGTG